MRGDVASLIHRWAQSTSGPRAITQATHCSLAGVLHSHTATVRSIAGSDWTFCTETTTARWKSSINNAITTKLEVITQLLTLLIMIPAVKMPPTLPFASQILVFQQFHISTFLMSPHMRLHWLQLLRDTSIMMHSGKCHQGMLSSCRQTVINVMEIHSRYLWGAILREPSIPSFLLVAIMLAISHIASLASIIRNQIYNITLF